MPTAAPAAPPAAPAAPPEPVPARRLFDEALALPEKERAELAEALLDSFHPPGEDLTPEQWRAAWEPELRRRMAESDAGAVKSVPWEEVRARLGMGGAADAG